MKFDRQRLTTIPKINKNAPRGILEIASKTQLKIISGRKNKSRVFMVWLTARKKLSKSELRYWVPKSPNEIATTN
jgi:hypothetical protein